MTIRKGLIFTVGKPNRNRMRVMGMTEEAKDDMLKGYAGVDVFHNLKKEGSIKRVYFDEAKYGFGIEADVSEALEEMIQNGAVTHWSWDGVPVRADNGEPVTAEDLADYSFANPLAVLIARIRSVSAVADPSHLEATIQNHLTEDKKYFKFSTVTNSIMSNTEDEKKVAGKPTPKEGGAKSQEQEKPPEQKPTPKEGEVKPTPKEGEQKPDTDTVQNQAIQKTFGVGVGQEEQKPLTSTVKNSTTCFNSFNDELSKVIGTAMNTGMVGTIANSTGTTTTGMQTDRLSKKWYDYIGTSSFISKFCDLKTGFLELPYTSVDDTGLPTLGFYDEGESTGGTDDGITFTGDSTKPIIACVFQHTVTELAEADGTIKSSDTSAILQKGAMKAVLIASLFGKDTTSGDIEGIVNNPNLTPTTAETNWSYSDFAKMKKNRPYARNGTFLLGQSDADKYHDSLDTLGNGTTSADMTNRWLKAGEPDVDFRVVGTARGKDIVVVQDDIIPVVANKQTRFYGNFEALQVHVSPMRITRDITTNANKREIIYRCIVYVDAKVKNLQQLNYQTGVDVS